MSKSLLVFLMILTGFLISENQTYAELVGGKVVDVDSGTKTLTINQTNPETEAQENIMVQIVGETDFLGLESFFNIRVGDEVWVEAEEDYVTNNWVASSIQRIADETTKTQKAGTDL
jgi:hypothetical protein